MAINSIINRYWPLLNANKPPNPSKSSCSINIDPSTCPVRRHAQQPCFKGIDPPRHQGPDKVLCPAHMAREMQMNMDQYVYTSLLIYIYTFIYIYTTIISEPFPTSITRKAIINQWDNYHYPLCMSISRAVDACDYFDDIEWFLMRCSMIQSTCHCWLRCGCWLVVDG